MQCGRHQLCHRIGLRIGEVQHSAHIADGTTGSHRTEGGDLCHMVSAVFAHHIVDHFTTAFLAKVRIKVGHTDTLGVQKTLEDQRVLHRIHFGDVHTVRHDGSSAGATTGTYGDAGFLGIANKIPDDEIVVHIAHPADDTDLIL